MKIPWEAVVAVLLYIIASTAGFIWWMATQTVKLEFALVALKEITVALTLATATYVTKVEIAEKLAVMNKNIDKNWEEIDKLRRT